MKCKINVSFNASNHTLGYYGDNDSFGSNSYLKSSAHNPSKTIQGLVIEFDKTLVYGSVDKLIFLDDDSAQDNPLANNPYSTCNILNNSLVENIGLSFGVWKHLDGYRNIDPTLLEKNFFPNDLSKSISPGAQLTQTGELNASNKAQSILLDKKNDAVIDLVKEFLNQTMPVVIVSWTIYPELIKYFVLQNFSDHLDRIHVVSGCAGYNKKLHQINQLAYEATEFPLPTQKLLIEQAIALNKNDQGAGFFFISSGAGSIYSADETIISIQIPSHPPKNKCDFDQIDNLFPVFEFLYKESGENQMQEWKTKHQWIPKHKTSDHSVQKIVCTGLLLVAFGLLLYFLLRNKNLN